MTQIDLKHCPNCGSTEPMEVTEQTCHLATYNDELDTFEVSHEQPEGFIAITCPYCGDNWKVEDIKQDITY